MLNLFGAKLYFLSVTVKQITFSCNKCNSFTFRCISVVIFISKVCKKVRVLETVHDIVGHQVSDLISQKIMTVNKASHWLIHNLGKVMLCMIFPSCSAVYFMPFSNTITRKLPL